jgi:hypothetical protein
MFLRRAIGVFFLATLGVFAQSQSQTLKLVDGGTIVGRIIAPKDQFLQVALDTGGANPVYTNVPWARLSQETLQELTKNRSVAPFANIFLDPPAQERRTTTARPKEIRITEPPRLDRPKDGNLFSSPVTLLLIFLAYAANIYAGWEIGIFRQWPPAMVAALAGVLPVLAPALFLAMPTRRPKEEAPVEVAAPVEEVQEVVEEAPAPVVEEKPAQPTLPPTVTFARGQFTFNRRFFETKFAGFLKMVPGEAERDKLLYFKTARGEYVGSRLAKVEPNELYVQIRKGTATEDVMVPYSEIYEVQIKHKDAP